MMLFMRIFLGIILSGIIAVFFVNAFADSPKYSCTNVSELEKLSANGSADAQNNLGVCYANGNGIEKNLTEAVKWYRKAAEQGYAWAQYNLGGCYANGNGVKKDLTKAVKWYRKAAELTLVSALARDIVIHNKINYHTRVTLSGNVQEKIRNFSNTGFYLQLEPRARHEVPNFIEDDIRYGDQIRIRFIVHVRTTILNDDTLYERIEKDVPGECNAIFRDNILFTISQSASSSNKEFSFICTASEYR